MKIGFGRRQLVVSVESICCEDQTEAYPMAVNASDAELARLSSLRNLALERSRWETTAIMYGAVRLRSVSSSGSEMASRTTPN